MMEHQSNLGLFRFSLNLDFSVYLSFDLTSAVLGPCHGSHGAARRGATPAAVKPGASVRRGAHGGGPLAPPWATAAAVGPGAVRCGAGGERGETTPSINSSNINRKQWKTNI